MDIQNRAQAHGSLPGSAMQGIAIVATILVTGIATAAPVTYELDPEHTFPSFEADHMGISVWRGKFNRTSGMLTVDREAGTGRVEAAVDMTSVDFGHDEMNAHAKAPDFFDVAKFPQATYTGTLERFVDGVPTHVDGELTLHGVTRPVALKVNSFKCIPHPLHKRELCGADALATFDRDDFGLTAGKDYGFDMSVTVRIQMEAVVPE
jgi:polyisoprenoid-binding protein YceI